MINIFDDKFYTNVEYNIFFAWIIFICAIIGIYNENFQIFAAGSAGGLSLMIILQYHIGKIRG